jgi:diguanylate cyclase (GGDEF)-like protein/PAS domain S-box-containing protein
MGLPDDAARSETESRFRDLFEDAPIAYHEIDSTGTIVRVNRAEALMLGLNAEGIVGTHAWDWAAPEERERSREAVRRKISGEQPLVPFEREFLSRDGRRLIAEVHERLIRDGSGKVLGIRSALLDITRRKKVEEELQSVNQKLGNRVKELERRTTEITLLSDMGGLLQTCGSAEEAYSVIAECGQQLFPQQSGALCMISASRNVVEAVATWGDPLPAERVFSPDECWALRRGRLHAVDSARGALRCKHAADGPPGPSTCAPLIAHGEALGVLHIAGPQEEGPTQQGDQDGDPGLGSGLRQRLTTAVCEQISLALANLKLRETLRLQSIRDQLTGLFNRRYLEESLERELRRAARKQRTLGAIMLDIDHFKRFNDEFGHDAGDAVLRALGKLLLRGVRGEDIACRYGGEEFTLILPEADAPTARDRADELRQAASQLHVEHAGRNLGFIELSFGVAVFPDNAASADSLLRAADEALGRAKRGGRNRVVVCETVLPQRYAEGKGAS